MLNKKMTAEVIIENRRLERFIVNVKVYKLDTGNVLGYTANMHTEGMMIKSADPIPLNEELDIKLEHLQFNDELIELPMRVIALWSSHDEDSDFIFTGFKIVDPTPTQRKTISNIIEELVI